MESITNYSHRRAVTFGGAGGYCTEKRVLRFRTEARYASPGGLERQTGTTLAHGLLSHGTMCAHLMMESVKQRYRPTFAVSTAVAAISCCFSRTMTLSRMPSHPNMSGFVFSRYWSNPPCYEHSPRVSTPAPFDTQVMLTFLTVLSARAVIFTRMNFWSVSEKRRLLCTLGSHVLRVLCFELGTLFPYSFVFPWNRPSCARLKGPLTAANRGIEGNMAEEGVR